MVQAAELAQDHHLAVNCTDELAWVLWNISCNIVRYVMESSEDMEIFFSFNEVIRSELLQLKRCNNYQEIIGQWLSCAPYRQ